MEAKSSRENQKRLDDLPPSDDKYWEYADINTGIIPKEINDENGHYFVRVTGHEAQCRYCSWGFALDPGDKVKDGHLFDKTGKLVI
jgi:hypothetical protein